MKISVNWLQDFVKIPPPLEAMAEKLTMAGLEVKRTESVQNPKDQLWEIEVTTNRPDWLSHFGVAREIAAVANLSLKAPEVKECKSREVPSGWRLDLKDAEACAYYSGVLIEGIQQGETPEFIRDRLKTCGIRSISLIVDITNYVLLETGQPLHAFDADLIKGKEIRVRRAKPGEKMTIIDGRELKLDSKDLVIADNEQAIALAGVMGGKSTEVGLATRNIFLESAFFHPRWVRQTAKRHGLSSESSYRFERRVDPEGVDFGRERALWLIKQYAKPRFISGVIKAGRKPTPDQASVLLSTDYLQKVTGAEFKSHQVTSILTRLGLDVSATSSKSWKVGIPSFRSDLARPVDLIEEITRIYGYDHIPETLPERPPLLVHESPTLRVEEAARNHFSGAGFFETVTFSLISKKGLAPEILENCVSIVNPQNQELHIMRPSLVSSLLEIAAKNSAWGNRDLALFEIANCYRRAPVGKIEEKIIGFLMMGNWKLKSWMDQSRLANFYDMKGMVEVFLEKLGIENAEFEPVKNVSYLHSEIGQIISKDGTNLGLIGQIREELSNEWDLENAVFVGELKIEALSAAAQWIRPMKDIPKYPATERDLSVTVSEFITAKEIMDMIRRLGKGLVVDINVFDLFHGGRIPKGFKNIGFRVTYQSLAGTLVSEKVQELHQSIAAEIVKKFQASFQS